MDAKYKKYFIIYLFNLFVLSWFIQSAQAATAGQIYNYFTAFKTPIQTTDLILSANPFSDFEIVSHVSPRTAQLVIQQQDFLYPVSRNLMLPLYRLYSPNFKDPSSLGLGWRWAFDINIRRVNETQLELVDLKGVSYLFNKVNDSIYENQNLGRQVISKTNQGFEYNYNQNLFLFNKTGKLIAIENPIGQSTSFKYENGQLRSIDIYGTNSIEFYYDKQNRLIEVLLPGGNVIRYEHEGELASKVTGPHSDSILYEYENKSLSTISTDMHAVVEIEQFSKTQETFISLTPRRNYAIDYRFKSFDSINFELERVLKFKDKSITTQYKCNNGKCIIIDPLGVQSKLDWHDVYKELPQYYESAESRNIQWQYNQQGKLIVKSKAGKLIDRYEYDDQERLKNLISARGTLTAFKYTKDSLIEKVEQAGTVINQFKYNEQGLIESASNATAQSLRFDYDQNSIPTSIYYNQTSVDLKYDDFYRISKIQVDNEPVAQLYYDADKRYINYKNLLTNQEQTITYSKDGIPVARKGLTTNHLDFKYDSNNRLTQLINLDEQTVELNYDAFDRLSEFTSIENLIYNFEFDSNNNLIKTSSESAGQQKILSYDKDGFKISEQTNAQDPVSFQYDNQGRLQAKHYGDQLVFRKTYNPDHHLIEVSTIDHHIRYLRDKLNRVKFMLVSSDKFKSVKEYEFDWNDKNQLAKLTYPSGTEVSYQYDLFNRLKNITVNNQKTISYDYTELGQVKVDYSNGMSSTYHENQFGRYSQIQHQGQHNNLLINNYFDSQGQLISKQIKPQFFTASDRISKPELGKIDPWLVDSKINHKKFQAFYEYQKDYQLSNYTIAYDGTKEFLINEFNRIETLKSKSTADSFEYKNDYLTKAGTRIFNYNKNNQLHSAEDENNQYLFSYGINDLLNSANMNSDNVDYSYDANESLIIRSTGNSEFTFDNLLNRRLSQNSDENSRREYIYSPDFETSLGFFNFSIDEKGQMNLDGEFYYHHDDANSPVLISDSIGRVNNYYLYDQFGQTLESVESVENDIGFCSMRFDKFIGMYQNGSFLYAPTSAWKFNSVFDFKETLTGQHNASKLTLGDFLNPTLSVSSDFMVSAVLTQESVTTGFFDISMLVENLLTADYHKFENCPGQGDITALEADISQLNDIFTLSIYRDINAILNLASSKPDRQVRTDAFKNFISRNHELIKNQQSVREKINTEFKHESSSLSLQSPTSLDQHDNQAKSDLTEATNQTDDNAAASINKESETEQPETKRIWLKSSDD